MPTASWRLLIGLAGVFATAFTIAGDHRPLPRSSEDPRSGMPWCLHTASQVVADDAGRFTARTPPHSYTVVGSAETRDLLRAAGLRPAIGRQPGLNVCLFQAFQLGEHIFVYARWTDFDPDDGETRGPFTRLMFERVGGRWVLDTVEWVG